MVIVMHTHPDGDAVGSALALHRYLSQAGADRLKVIAPNAYPDFLHWMQGHEQVMIAEQDLEAARRLIAGADILFCLDFNGFSRAEGLEDALRDSRALKVMIDHHPEPEEGFDLQYSDTSASSTAELVYLFIGQLGGERRIDRIAAECLYAGIITDTGSLSYGCNNPRTYEILARLISRGVDCATIHRLIYSTYTVDRMRLLGYCLGEGLVVLPEVNAAYISLSRDVLKRFNHREGDTEGFVNYALAIQDIRLAALFVEKEDHVKISLRSVGDLDVNAMARQYFNGGGHRNAAGGKSFNKLGQTIEDFTAVIHRKKLAI